MKKRFITAVFMTLVVAGFFGLRFINNYFFDVLIGIILICGACEVSRVFNRSNRYNNMTLVSIYPVFLFLTFMFCLTKEYGFWLTLSAELAVFIVFALICFLWTILDKKSIALECAEDKTYKYVFKKVGLSCFIMLYPSLILGTMFAINHIGDLNWIYLSDGMNFGLFMLLIVFATTVLTDTFAYLFGSTLKGPKLCPMISPNKTISGAIGGLCGGIVSAIIAFAICSSMQIYSTFFVANGMTIWIFILYGFIASIFTQIGDIFASWLKRRARTKDFSSIFPGHGGFMDRVDGLTFNSLISLVFFLILLA